MKKNIQRIVSALLSVCFFVVFFSVPIKATQAPICNENEGTIMFEKSKTTEELCQEIAFVETYFSTEEILAFADYHRETYLEGKISGKPVVVGEEIIPMYNTCDELSVWYVPFLYEDGTVAGTIIIGSNMNAYNFYALIETPEDYLSAKELYEQGKELIFVLPYDFLYKEESVYYNCEDQAIFIESPVPSYTAQRNTEEETNLDEMDIEEIIALSEEAAYTDELLNQNRSENATLLDIISKKDNEIVKERNVIERANLLAAQRIDARLTQEWASTPYFLGIKDGQYTRYGGNQRWFANALDKEEGCGTVAAANITAYMARYKVGKYGLYQGGGSPTNITRAQFVTHMNAVAAWVSPRMGWVPGVTASSLVKGVIGYAGARKVSLVQDKSITNLGDFWNACDYIVQSLRDDRPVAICVYDNNGVLPNSDYAWHWMTITKYFQDTADMRWVALSTWNQRHSVNWRLLHNYQGTLGIFSGVYDRIFSFK